MTRPPHLDHAMERDLTALADGSISPPRRERVERAVAASPELQRELAAQRYAVGVVRAAATERAPAALRFELAAATPRPRRRIRIGALAAAGAAAAAAGAVLVIPGSPSQDASVADAAALATRPPVAGVTQPARDEASLASPRGAGLRFPAW